MKIKAASTQKDFFNCVRVRLSVFVEEQKVNCSLEQDEYDDYAIHYVVYDGEKGIAACRLIEESDCMHLGRLAVLKEYRGKQVGKKLLEEIEKHPTVKSKGKICLHAQLHAKEFYLKCGYREVGDIFYEANIAHVMMEKKI